MLHKILGKQLGRQLFEQISISIIYVSKICVGKSLIKTDLALYMTILINKQIDII